jgi:hypothetical protein
MPPKTCMTPAAFNRLSSSSKAILVAQDVIAQLRSKKYIAETGVYIFPNFTYDHENGRYISTEKNKNLSTASPQAKKIIADAECHVCGKGSMLLSAITFSNKMSLLELDAIINDGSWGNDRKIVNKICNKDKIFTRKNLHLIELAFESTEWNLYDGECKSGFGADNSMKNKTAAVKFGMQFFDDDTRLSAICLNIIANRGIFNPHINIPTLEQANKAITIKSRKKFKKTKTAKRIKVAS